MRPLSHHAMQYDRDRVDEAVLALLYLTMHRDGSGTRAWKRHDWDAMDRLYEKGYISDPKGKAKSVRMTDDGRAKSEEIFRRLFATEG
jgi:hypothetical protein